MFAFVLVDLFTMGLWATWEHYIEDRKANKMQSINYFYEEEALL